jgi:hypothetical protein
VFLMTVRLPHLRAYKVLSLVSGQSLLTVDAIKEITVDYGEDCERGPCETDDVTLAKFRRLGGPAGQGEGRER